MNAFPRVMMGEGLQTIETPIPLTHQSLLSH